MALLMDRGKPVSRYKVSEDAQKYLCSALLDQNQPIFERFRALSVRHISGTASIDALTRAMRDPSILLAYNAAYELGRMQDFDSIPALEAVLKDLCLHPIVRHKAAEALGTFSSERIVPILKNSLVVDPIQEVRETCELALCQIKRLEESPLEPASPDFCLSVSKSREVLLNEENSIYQRYTALFELRNQSSLQNDAAEQAFSSIIQSLGAKSILLRHGVVYVLSQLENRNATYFLSNILRSVHEHPMVRLEAAKALGSIADEHAVMLLDSFVHDPEPIVSQSCEVALNKLNFRRSVKPFEMVPLRDYPTGRLVIQTSVEKEKFLCNLLLNQNIQIWKRFRAFSGGELNGSTFRNAFIEAMRDDSILLAYNAACELVEMRDFDTIPALKVVLKDLSLHPIVRHKAAEALGAFGLERNVPVLRDSMASDPTLEVRETCELAVGRIQELKNASPLYSRFFASPLPVAPVFCFSIPKLREVVFAEDSTMYERVAAVFGLKHVWTFQKKEEAISAIIECRGVKSALLRYWVARNLSSTIEEKAVDPLSEILRDVHEHPLVRQEAARGLGCLAADGVLSNVCIFLLEEFAKDPEPIVAQRCEVALKMLDFKRLGRPFQLVEVEESRSWAEPSLILSR